MQRNNGEDCLNAQGPAADEVKLLDELTKLQSRELKEHWLQVFGSKPPKRMSREMMTREIAYRLQEQADGGLKPATKRKLATLVTEYEERGKITLPSKPLYKPGTKLIREWQGKTHCVIVLDNGFEYDGERYHSLSAVARKITGAHWSGPRFFGIKS